jgi:C4-type Zn-finger protein
MRSIHSPRSSGEANCPVCGGTMKVISFVTIVL